MEEILREFYDLRLKMYEKRKAYMVISKIKKGPMYVYLEDGLHGNFKRILLYACMELSKGSRSNPILSGGKFGWRGEKVVESGAVHLGEV